MKLSSLFIASGLLGLSMTTQASDVPPQNVVATAQGNDSVEISWDAVDDAAYYDVYENGMDRIANGVTEQSYLRTGLSADTFYQYFVTACSADGVCSEASMQSDVTTGGGDVVEPMPDTGPTNPEPVVTYSLNNDGTATLKWAAVDGAQGYNVFINNNYVDTVFGLSFEEFTAIVAYNEGDEYQVAWYAGDNYPAKSAVATLETMMDGGDSNSFAAIDAATAGSDTDVEIYFTRHAEKMTELLELENGNFEEVCGSSKCSEVLNPAGELRAALLVSAFADAGVTSRLTHAFSSHKTRTRQTIEAIVAAAGLSGDVDKNAGDGIQENPVMNDDGTANATELDPQSTSGSEQPTIDALLGLSAGSVALVAGHSGTLYDIMAGLGLTDVCLEDTADTCNQDRYPIDSSFKVRDFGDIWKVVLQDGVPSFAYRINLQPVALEVSNVAK